MSIGESEIERRLEKCRDKLKGLILELPGLAAELDFLSGGLFSLFLAHKYRHEGRHKLPGPMYVANLAHRVGSMKSGAIPAKSRRWLAGYFFNSALMRLDMVEERIKESAMDYLEGQDLLDSPKPDPTQHNQSRLRQEVVNLKHYWKGQWKRRLVTWEIVLSELEELLEFIENRKEEFKRLPPVKTLKH